MTLDKLTMEQLHGSQLEIAEVIGMEAYRKLVASYGGSSIYISKADSVMKDSASVGATAQPILQESFWSFSSGISIF